MDKLYLQSLLEQGLNYKEVGSIVNLDGRTVQYWAKKFGLSYLNKRNHGRRLPKNFIEKVDTKEKAYLVGFILGDGHINELDSVELSQCLADKEVVYKLAKIIDADVHLDLTLNKKTRRFPRARITKKIPMISKILGGRVKRDRHFPRIKDELMPHLLRGLFDADGGVSFGYRKDRNRLWVCCRFVHHLKCLQGLQQFLIKKLNISTTVRPKSKENAFVLDMCSIKEAVKFLDYIYSDTNSIMLERKYNKYRALRLELDEFGGTAQSTIPSRAA